MPLVVNGLECLDMGRILGGSFGTTTGFYSEGPQIINQTYTPNLQSRRPFRIRGFRKKEREFLYLPNSRGASQFTPFLKFSPLGKRSWDPFRRRGGGLKRMGPGLRGRNTPRNI